jgi:hypothetical protein
MAQLFTFVRKRALEPQDWTNAELAELYRVEAALCGARLTPETDRGLTDEGEPWFVFCRADGEVVVHITRSGGYYRLFSPVLPQPILGVSFADITKQFIAEMPVKVTGASRVVVHPSALLSVLVGTLFFLLDGVNAPYAEAADEMGQGLSEGASQEPLTLKQLLAAVILDLDRSAQAREADAINRDADGSSNFARYVTLVGALVVVASGVEIGGPNGPVDGLIDVAGSDAAAAAHVAAARAEGDASAFDDAALMRALAHDLARRHDVFAGIQGDELDASAGEGHNQLAVANTPVAAQQATDVANVSGPTPVTNVLVALDQRADQESASASASALPDVAANETSTTHTTLEESTARAQQAVAQSQAQTAAVVTVPAVIVETVNTTALVSLPLSPVPDAFVSALSELTFSAFSEGLTVSSFVSEISDLLDDLSSNSGTVNTPSIVDIVTVTTPVVETGNTSVTPVTGGQPVVQSVFDLAVAARFAMQLQTNAFTTESIVDFQEFFENASDGVERYVDGSTIVLVDRNYFEDPRGLVDIRKFGVEGGTTITLIGYFDYAADVLGL